MKKRVELVKRNSEEVIGEERLVEILKKKSPITYCGYETSGKIHLGHLVTITKLLDLQKAGFHVKVLFADWHTWLNKKGEWNFIKNQTKEWKKGFQAAGLKKAEFVLGSSFQRKIDYVDDILKMSLKTTMNRALRSMQQVARDIENSKVSQVIYPLMQIADIKHLKVDLVQAGIEQRKIHMLGVELFPEIDYKTPCFVHTPLIPSLKGEGKMSSSEGLSFISIDDDEKEIGNKVNKAFCPEGQIKDNPVLSILRLIIFPRKEVVEIKRPDKFGGDKSYSNYAELEKDFKSKKIHPADLKACVRDNLIEILEPIKKALNHKT